MKVETVATPVYALTLTEREIDLLRKMAAHASRTDTGDPRSDVRAFASDLWNTLYSVQSGL